MISLPLFAVGGEGASGASSKSTPSSVSERLVARHQNQVKAAEEVKAAEDAASSLGIPALAHDTAAAILSAMTDTTATLIEQVPSGSNRRSQANQGKSLLGVSIKPSRQFNCACLLFLLR